MPGQLTNTDDTAERERPRFITIRRGGTLTDAHHHLLALWAATCAEHVLPFFESVQPADPRPRLAIEQIRAWTRGEIKMSQSRAAGGHAMAAARELSGAARNAAYAAAYAIKAVMASVQENEKDKVGQQECQWQRNQLPDAIRHLVLDDQSLRNHICWFDFAC